MYFNEEEVTVITVKLLNYNLIIKLSFYFVFVILRTLLIRMVKWGST